MLEHRVRLGRNPQPRELGGLARELANLDAADVIDAPGFVGVADDAVRHVADLPGNGSEIRHEAIPLGGDACVRSHVSFAEPEDEQRVAANHARRGDERSFAVIHSDCLHEIEARHVAALAQLVGCQAELLTERAGEGFVRAIARIERDRQDVRRSADERSGGQAQAARAHIRRKRAPGGHAERPRQMKPRDPHHAGDGFERQVAAQVALDVPEGSGSHAHDGSIITVPPDVRLTVVAVRSD